MSQARLEELLDQGGLDKTLSIAYEQLTPDEVIATMPVTPRHLQPLGYLHGGASVVLAESVASVGGMLSCGPGMAAFGMEINANHVRPKQDGMLRAVGRPLFKGRSSHVWEIKIYDERARLICAARCTLALVKVPERPPSPPSAPSPQT